MNFYKRHLGDIAKSCSDLSQGQMGAYDLLLDWHYANEKPLPLALEKLYRIGRAVTAAERANVDSVLAELFTLTDAGYTHKRAAEEMAKANAQAETNREIALRREALRRARTVHESCNEPSNESCTKRQPSQTPDSISQDQEQKRKGGKPPEVALPDWLSPDVWQDWHAFRNARKGWTAKARALSLRTLTTLRDEGQDPRAVVDQSIERGWTGLFPVRHGDSRAGPAAPAVGKTMGAILDLEEMKRGLVGGGNSDGVAALALPRA